MWVMGNTAVYRRQALVDAGGYIQELGPFSDSCIQMVTVLRHGACFIPEPLAAFRVTGSNYSMTALQAPGASEKVWAHARHLMETEFKDLFTPKLVDTLERIWRFGEQYQAWLRADARHSGSGAAAALARTRFRLKLAARRGLLGMGARRAWMRLRFRMAHPRGFPKPELPGGSNQ